MIRIHKPNAPASIPNNLENTDKTDMIALPLSIFTPDPPSLPPLHGISGGLDLPNTRLTAHCLNSR